MKTGNVQVESHGLKRWTWSPSAAVFQNIDTHFVVDRSVVDRMVMTNISGRKRTLEELLDYIEMEAVKKESEIQAVAHTKKEREAQIASKMRIKKNRATIAIDFDGVIHTYEKGWDDGTIYGEMKPGAIEGLSYLLNIFNVYVLTSRDPAQVKQWMMKRFEYPIVLVSDKELFWDTRGVLGVTNRKLPAIAYIDDRAVPFTNWDKMVEALTKGGHNE